MLSCFECLKQNVYKTYHSVIKYFILLNFIKPNFIGVTNSALAEWWHWAIFIHYNMLWTSWMQVQCNLNIGYVISTTVLRKKSKKRIGLKITKSQTHENRLHIVTRHQIFMWLTQRVQKKLNYLGLISLPQRHIEMLSFQEVQSYNCKNRTFLLIQN